MSLELQGPVLNEQVLFDDRLVLVIKDPFGMCELMAGKESFPLCVHHDSDIKNIYDASLRFNPADGTSERFLAGTIEYDPGLFPKSAHERFSQLFSDLTEDDSFFSRGQIALVKDQATGSQGLIISLDETGQTIRIYDVPKEDKSPVSRAIMYADFGGRNDLDVDLAARTAAAWYIAQISLGRADDSFAEGPHHMILESLAYDKLAELEDTTAYFRKFQKLDNKRVPELVISETELYLLAECGLSPERYAHILDELKNRWGKVYDSGSSVGVIRASDIAELMSVLNY